MSALSGHLVNQFAKIIPQIMDYGNTEIFMRNRWRRMQLDVSLRQEVTPKNILMIGPTGVGKTEIARRLAKLADAPFIKVEATKFTEVGYVGKEVDSIIRDLIEIAIKMMRHQAINKVQSRAVELAETRILKVLFAKKQHSVTLKGEEMGDNAPAVVRAVTYWCIR